MGTNFENLINEYAFEIKVYPNRTVRKFLVGNRIVPLFKLASHLGISEKLFRNYLQGTPPPPPDFIEKLVTELKLSSNDYYLFVNAVQEDILESNLKQKQLKIENIRQEINLIQIELDIHKALDNLLRNNNTDKIIKTANKYLSYLSTFKQNNDTKFLEGSWRALRAFARINTLPQDLVYLSTHSDLSWIEENIGSFNNGRCLLLIRDLANGLLAGMSLRQAGKKDEALNYFTSSIEKGIHSPTLRTLAYGDVLKIYGSKGNFAEFEWWNREAQNLIQSQDLPLDSIATVIAAIAHGYVDLDNVDKGNMHLAQISDLSKLSDPNVTRLILQSKFLLAIKDNNHDAESLIEIGSYSNQYFVAGGFARTQTRLIEQFSLHQDPTVAEFAKSLNRI